MEFAGLAYALLAANALRLASFRGRQDRGQEGYECANDQDAAKRDGSMQSAIGHRSGSCAVSRAVYLGLRLTASGRPRRQFVKLIGPLRHDGALERPGCLARGYAHAS